MDKYKQISRFAEPKQSPGFLLWHISTSWRSFIEAVLKNFELTHPQFVVLAATGWLNQQGASTTQVMVGKMAGLDPNTTSQIIKGLEAKALVERKPALDGRAKHVLLTSKGLHVFQSALPAVEQADQKFFSILSQETLHSLVQIFQQLGSITNPF